MSRKKGILKITLNSDLCVSSGYAFAGIIDSDVCYDDNGIPYIPGRRLKGCLKEAGELIRTQESDRLFGSSGSNGTKGIIIGNAYPLEYDKYEVLCRELKGLMNNADYSEYLSQQKVLEYYTRVKAQTSIDRETGVAKDTSLRYIRVINQYLPGEENEPLSFYAEVEFNDEDEKELDRIVKAMRHIGLNRTRGLGNVSCTLENISEVDNEPTERVENTAKSDTYIKLDYVIKNEQPLMLSMGNDQKTELYINGASVLGALAGAYLNQDGKSAEDDMFRNIFLGGKAIFTNLTPTLLDDRGYRSYTPAPLFLNRLKKTKKLRNVMFLENSRQNGENETKEGNLPKRLNTQFVSLSKDGKEAFLTEPAVEIIYHHSRKQPSADGEDGILYSLEAIKEGQFFKGSILAEEKYINELRPLLLKGQRLRFGKSKSAQYGTCRIVEVNEHSDWKNDEINAGEKIVVVLESDAVFCNETGYTVRYEEVRKALADSLGIEEVEVSEDISEEHDAMKTRVITGYNTMWNLKKPAIPAVMAGSYFIYTVAKECKMKHFVGEKNLEGFGQIGIYKLRDMQYKVKQVETELTVTEKKSGKSSDLVSKIMEESFKDELKEQLLNKVLSEENNWRINASTLGRIILMLKESKGNRKEYISRIDAIREEGKKEEVKKILEFLNKFIDDVTKQYKKDNRFAHINIKERWGEFLLYVLIQQKYEKKIEEATDNA